MNYVIRRNSGLDTLMGKINIYHNFDGRIKIPLRYSLCWGHHFLSRSGFDDHLQFVRLVVDLSDRFELTIPSFAVGKVPLDFRDTNG